MNKKQKIAMDKIKKIISEQTPEEQPEFFQLIPDIGTEIAIQAIELITFPAEGGGMTLLDHPNEKAVLIVLKGLGLLANLEEKKPLKQGDIVCVPADDNVLLMGTENEPMRLISIRYKVLSNPK